MIYFMEQTRGVSMITDEDMWNKVNGGSADGYDEYISMFPTGVHADVCHDRSRLIRKQQAQDVVINTGAPFEALIKDDLDKKSRTWLGSEFKEAIQSRDSGNTNKWLADRKADIQAMESQAAFERKEREMQADHDKFMREFRLEFPIK